LELKRSKRTPLKFATHNLSFNPKRKWRKKKNKEDKDEQWERE